MKKVLISAAVTLLAAGVAFSGTIVGSKHDMKTWIGNETTTQVCVFCHVPHGGSAAAPLWNHTASTANYTIYQSATIQGTTSQPGGVSKACLSCHDGTVAINSVIVAPRDGSVGTSPAAGRSSLMMNATDDGTLYLGTDLSNDHPVTITYEPAKDTALRANTGATVANGTITLPLYGTAAPYTVECASCHNVHDPANTPFLRVANTNSQLCTTCHAK